MTTSSQDERVLVEELLYSRHRAMQTRTSPSEITQVRHKQRLIDVLAVPYNTPTVIHDPEGSFLETVDPGAFAGVEIRAQRIKALRDHEPRLAVGRGQAMYPHKAAGLEATLQISRTDLGDETLELAQDGVLDCSIGFHVMKDGSVWDRDMGAVRHMKLYLQEISFVPFPAYEGATVAGVRLLWQDRVIEPSFGPDDQVVEGEVIRSTTALTFTEPATPNLTALEAAIEAERYARTRIVS